MSEQSLLSRVTEMCERQRDEIKSLTAEVTRRDDYLRRALHWLDSDLANRYQFPQDIRGWVNSVKVCIVPASGSRVPWPEGATNCEKCSEDAVIKIDGVVHCLNCGASVDSSQ